MLQLLAVSTILNFAGLCSVSFSGDGKILACAQKDGSIDIWSTEYWSHSATLRAPGTPTALGVSQKGDGVACGTNDTLNWWWRPGPIWQHYGEMKFPGTVRTVQFSHDRESVACGLAGVGCIQIYDAWYATLKNLLFERGNGIGTIRFSKDDKRLLSAGQTLIMWDPTKITKLTSRGSAIAVERDKDGQESAFLWRHPTYVEAACFSPDSSLFAAVGHFSGEDQGFARTLVVGKSKDHSELARFRSEKEPFTCVDWSSDSKWIAAGCEDGNVWVWDWASKSMARKIGIEGGPVRSISFRFNTAELAVATDQGVGKIVDAATGKVVRGL